VSASLISSERKGAEWLWLTVLEHWAAWYYSSGRSKPTPTTGKGRFGVRPLGLSPGPDGSIVMAVEVQRPQQPRYIGQQTWDGKSWTKPEMVKDLDMGGMIATPWGDQLVLWPGEASLLSQGRQKAYPWISRYSDVPVVNDSAGRIVAYLSDQQGGTLRVWNGEQWSNTLRCGEATQVTPTPDGRIWLGKWQSDGVQLQEILVRELPGPSAPTGTAPSP